MATFTTVPKSTSVFTNLNHNNFIPIGSAMGLLLALTYSVPDSSVNFTTIVKATQAVFTNLIKD